MRQVGVLLKQRALENSVYRQAGYCNHLHLLLVQELKQELQSDELARALEKGAGEIGLDGEELVREVMNHPEQAAELICLAAEIRKQGNDETILAELLVDYGERIGSDLAVNAVLVERLIDSANTLRTEIRSYLEASGS